MTDSIPLPENCLRGLRRASWAENGFVATHAFKPDAKKPRQDGGFDLSVNLEDDAGAVESILSNPNAQHGAARISFSSIDSILRIAGRGGELWGERAELPDNHYHGNLVYAESLPPIVRTQLAGAVAAASRLIERSG